MRDRQYKQSLRIKSAIDGILALKQNANSLYEDAEFLFKNERYARAIALAVLSIEESGKPSILRSILLESDIQERNELWKSFRSHHQKNSMWIVPELIINGARHIDNMKKVVDNQSDHPETLENLKQLCLYSDVFSRCKWTTPDNIATREMAESLLQIAKISLRNDPFDTEQCLYIWVKHLQPVWKKSMDLMKSALYNCYLECEDKGLIKVGLSKKMFDFLYGL